MIEPLALVRLIVVFLPVALILTSLDVPLSTKVMVLLSLSFTSAVIPPKLSPPLLTVMLPLELNDTGP